MLLLEAGPRDNYLWIHLPIGYAKTMFHPVYNWGFHTEPEPGMNNRQVYWPRGRGLGGSSSINGLIYIRGQHEDYDHWAALGNAGWGWRDVLPYFIKCEGNSTRRERISRRRRAARLLRYRRAASADGRDHRWRRRARRAAQRRFQRRAQEGVGYFQLFTRNGWRCSTAVGYLKPARRRANLRVETEARATALVMDGKRAVGVRYRQHGAEHEVRAAREVLLAAGALQSPQLLQLSGIGRASFLQRWHRRGA